MSAVPAANFIGTWPGALRIYHEASDFGGGVLVAAVCIVWLTVLLARKLRS